MKVVNNGLTIEINGALGHFPKEFVVSALEKQIPKKPVPTQQPCKSRFACSICDKRLYSKQKFCDRCGQALDWSDTE